VVHRYIVLRTLGRGGMGVVYLAFDSELERKVALKLLGTHSDSAPTSTTPNVRARLLREAQAMAKLSHPNVLPVYDVGSYADAIFMAAEYVEGGTLGEWLTNQPRTWREIVHVFVAAGRGLAAAHAAGLVHGDFKPHNVMIGNDGQVRVMDFGLAREVSEDIDDVSSVHLDIAGVDLQRTDASSRVDMGTPAYMAPEQHMAIDFDARADQFSFCAALYESLYGLRPFSSQRSEMLDACHNRRVTPPTLRRKVPSWLHKLVLRGLSFRPEHRFASMDDVLQALSRRSGKPLTWAVVASVAMMVLLAGAAWAQHFAEQAQMCSGGPTKMAAIWSEARIVQAKRAFSATGVSYADDTWLRVEKLIEPYATEWLGVYRESCEATRVHEQQSETLMDLRMQCLERRLWDLDGLMKTFSKADAKVVMRAVEATTSLLSLAGCSDAERLQAQTPPPNDPHVRARVDALRQQLAESTALAASGKTKEGLDGVRSIIDEATRLDYGPLQAESWLLLGRLKTDALDPSAEAAVTQAVLLAEANKMDELRARSAVLLVRVVSLVQMRLREAQSWGKLAKAAIDRMGGDIGLEAELLGGLGDAFRIEGDYMHARELALQLIALLEPVKRTDPRSYGWGGLRLAGTTARKLGEYDVARAYLEHALEVLEQTLGPGHPHCADTLVELARTWLLQGEYAQAHATLARAQTIVETSLGDDGAPLSAQILLHQGRVFLHEGHHAHAEERIERALNTYLRLVPADHPQLGYTRIFMGEVYRRQGRFDEAQAQFEGAMNIRGRLVFVLIYALTGIGRTHLDRGDASAALEPLERAMSLIDPLGKNVRAKERAEASFALGRALWASGRDPSRGHLLVSQARDAFATTGKDQARDLAAAETWLRQHARP